MKIATSLLLWFFFLDRCRMGLRKRVMPYSGYLPRDLYSGLASLDCETIVLDLPYHGRHGELADGRELIPKVFVKCLKV
jgi:hypothetical protein